MGAGSNLAALGLLFSGLAGQGLRHKVFDFRFSYESVSPKPLSIPLGRELTTGANSNNSNKSVFFIYPQFFSKIRGDIRSSRCTTGVVDTGGK